MKRSRIKWALLIGGVTLFTVPLVGCNLASDANGVFLGIVEVTEPSEFSGATGYVDFALLEQAQPGDPVTGEISVSYSGPFQADAEFDVQGEYDGRLTLVDSSTGGKNLDLQGLIFAAEIYRWVSGSVTMNVMIEGQTRQIQGTIQLLGIGNAQLVQSARAKRELR